MTRKKAFTPESFYNLFAACDGEPNQGLLAYDSSAGFLHLNFENLCGISYRIGDWNEGLSLWRWENFLGKWVLHDEDPQLPLRLMEFTNPECPLARWASTIPLEIRTRTTSITYCRHTLLRFLRLVPESMELFCDNPNLMWMLAHAVYNKRISEKEAMEYLTGPRRLIARAICGLNSNAVVNFFSRLVIPCNDNTAASVLEKLAGNLAVRRKVARFDQFPLAHVDEIKKIDTIIDCLFYRKEIIPIAISHPRKRLLNEVKEIWYDCLQIGRALHIQQLTVKHAIQACPTMAALNALHNRWTERLNEQNIKAAQSDEDVLFPSPPINGNDDIQPIASLYELRKEGVTMHHCVASYAKRVLNGQSYIYRVLKPERATLELQNRGNYWILGQLRCIINKQPAEETKSKVVEWMRASDTGG
jgi:hypothetical protein